MDLAELIAAIPSRFYWIAGKGRERAAEPLYGIQILDPETRVVIAQAEAETLEDSIAQALQLIPAEVV